MILFDAFSGDLRWMGQSDLSFTVYRIPYINAGFNFCSEMI